MKTALIVLIAILLIGGGIYAYQRADDDLTGENGTNVVCTMDAKLCPDGSYVGRTGPNCEFALCPSETATSTVSGVGGTVVTSTSTRLTSTSTIALPKSVTVTLTSSGFSPKQAIIAKGGTITFVNKSNIAMRVASDPHPTHNGYPEFDQGAQVVNDGSWSFTFDKVGSWGYHNHVSPTQGAVIIVQ